jgi:hypothetical protein
MSKMIIRVRDFSIYPNTRHKDEGENSGEAFYENKLKPAYQEAIKNGVMLVVDLDGTEGYATSFLDEAFGLLAEDFGSTNVLKNIQIKSLEEPDWIEEIRSYILERDEIH